jgi:cholestenol delta-isomerase
MTFSDSSAPYPYKNAPSRVWVDEDMQHIAGFQSYAQAGTALFGVMRRLMMIGQRAENEYQETTGEGQDMMAITKRDLASWEYKMAEFERNHANPHDQKGAISIRLYHTLMRTFLAGGAFGSELRWDNLLGLYERILTLAETLCASTQSFHVNSPLSLEPGVIVPVFMVAQRCRHPWLRRRAITLLYKLKRQEGMWFSDGAAAVSKKIMEIEGQTYFESDLANDDDNVAAFAFRDIPWEMWAAVDVESLPARTSWAGIERVPEEKRMRETMVMVFTEERRIELSLIMSSGDVLGTYGEVRTESIIY